MQNLKKKTKNKHFPDGTNGKEPPIAWRGHGNPFQYSCLKNPMDRGTWQAIVHRAAKSQT